MFQRAKGVARAQVYCDVLAIGGLYVRSTSVLHVPQNQPQGHNSSICGIVVEVERSQFMFIM